MHLGTFVETSNRVAATRCHREKSALLAALLRELHEQEIDIAVRYLSGELPQGKIGLGPALARSAAMHTPAAQPQATSCLSRSFRINSRSRWRSQTSCSPTSRVTGPSTSSQSV
jgi:hypothetical protein